MSDLINFRDFGGQVSRHGGRVACGRLYRCGAPQVIEPLLRYRFDHVGDLRNPDEVHGYAPAWPQEIADRMVFVDGARVGEAPHLGIVSHPELSLDVIDRYYLDLYPQIVTDRHYSAAFSRLIKRLGSQDGRMLFYCAAGKDRTGTLAALILDMLGVGADDILADYLRSSGDPGLLAMAPMVLDNIERATGVRRDISIALRLLDVRPEYLAAMFGSIRDEYGSTEGYLDAIGVTRDDRMQACSSLLEH